MVIVNLAGGLGNQMFQYAQGLAYSLDHERQLKVTVDSFALYPGHNGFELESVFGLDLNVATRQEIQSVIGWWRANPQVRRIIGRFEMPTFIRGESFITEKPGANNPLQIIKSDGPVYLHGYWQNDLYFSHHAELIRKHFRFQEITDHLNLQIRNEIELTRCPVSIHVRRGDYLSSTKARSVHGACSSSYYREAIQAILDRFEGIRFFGFSDDPDWLSETIGPMVPDLVCVGNNRGINSYVDMQLMSSCRHHIIANSTFSWWGAWLNPSSHKTVIAPNQWFANGKSDNGIIPDDWLRI